MTCKHDGPQERHVPRPRWSIFCDTSHPICPPNQGIVESRVFQHIAMVINGHKYRFTTSSWDFALLAHSVAHQKVEQQLLLGRRITDMPICKKHPIQCQIKHWKGYDGAETKATKSNTTQAVEPEFNIYCIKIVWIKYIQCIMVPFLNGNAPDAKPL